MVNKVVLIGNLGRYPELFRMQGGRAVARLSIATNEVCRTVRRPFSHHA